MTTTITADNGSQLPEGRYILTFVGNCNGVIACFNLYHFRNVVQDTFLSETIVNEIMNPADGLPFYFHKEFSAAYDLRIYRMIELSG